MPGMIGECSTNHHLNIGIGLPDLLDGLEAVPSRRHAHIDEGQRVWSSWQRRPAPPYESPLSPWSAKLNSKDSPLDCDRRLVEQGRSRLIEFVRGGSRRQGFPEILVDSQVVVDDEDTAVFG